MESYNNSGHRPGGTASGLTLTRLLVGVATAPVLAGLWGAQTLFESTIALGEASEELFRGDRLPILNVPHDESESQKAQST
ncbi:hypothetical protein NEA10_01145 [Phormidium yuhuli AB48]|uniref:Uncharacterized protein n=1 Tax=Phormidium yuhuli AB48 TaxID=2940671 RepID=A0ABY5AQ87_9CYAN|nr:hypothetical protein [Phormidium yuhuli]USR91380.1 hypothetical protein NEA10_01145 [Phormidium yuhuli AB48]